MGWYIVITEEMRALGLTGNELVVYAALHAYSQKGDGCYYGGQTLLAERCGVTTRTLRNILDSLEDKGLLEVFPVVRNAHSIPAYSVRPPEKISGGERKKFPVATGKNFLQKENIINTCTNVQDSVCNNAHTRGFKAPTEEEVAAFCRERGLGIDPAEFIGHYNSNGWMVGKAHMKDWKAAVQNWDRRRRQGTSPAAPSMRHDKGDYVMQNLRTLDELQGTHYVEDYYKAKETRS